jgi:hypothetical protein
MRVGRLTACILELRIAYCPAEPATSSMDIALRLLAFSARGAEGKRGLHNIMSLSAPQLIRWRPVIVMLYRAEATITQDEEGK